MDLILQPMLAAAVSFFIITLIFSGVYILCRASSKSQAPNSHSQPVNSYIAEAAAAGESATFDPSLHRISMDELIAATSNFDPSGIIGDGGFGLVYKATLANGVTVAAKKLSADAFQGFREFRAEMETLGKLRNPNIVKILGYCSSGQDRILIYEFMERGSLDQWLHDDDDDDDDAPSSSMSWGTRMNVVRGVASGLAYLHGLDKPIIHRDIKASNVLLDSSFEAHIADFGLARRIEGTNHSHVSTQVAGTMGYMPPEYRAGFTTATAKADVYSFGILLFEVATGKRPNLPVTDQNGKDIQLVEWARRMAVTGQVFQIVDPKLLLSSEALREDDLIEFFRIASLCTAVSSRERPLMKEVTKLINPLCRQLL